MVVVRLDIFCAENAWYDHKSTIWIVRGIISGDYGITYVVGLRAELRAPQKHDMNHVTL